MRRPGSMWASEVEMLQHSRALRAGTVNENVESVLGQTMDITSVGIKIISLANPEDQKGAIGLEHALGFSEMPFNKSHSRFGDQPVITRAFLNKPWNVMMLDIDGHETKRKIHESDKYFSLPIVAMTAKPIKSVARNDSAGCQSDYAAESMVTDPCCFWLSDASDEREYRYSLIAYQEHSPDAI
jgi:hypothetical protein